MSGSRIDPAQRTAAPATALIVVILSLVFASAAHALTPTTTTLAADPPAPVAWEITTFTATVSSMAITPAITGEVQFSDEAGGLLGNPVPLDANGAASIDLIAGAGTHALHAHYSGDATYEPSDASVDQSVTQASSVTSVAISANPAAFDAEIVWSIDVSAVAPSIGIPSGSVFVDVDNGALVGDFDLDATGHVDVGATLSPGDHAVTIYYFGDADYFASLASFTQTVLAPPAPPAPPPASGGAASSVPPLSVTPVLRPLSTRALLAALKVPATLRATAGGVTVGTATNPPVRSVSVQLVQAPPSGRGFVAAARPVLGRASVTVPAGARRSIKVKLSRAARKTLQRRGRLRVQVRISAVDRTGRTVKTTTGRKLLAPR